MKKIIPILVCLVLLCGCGAPRPADSGKLRAVATIFPLYDFVRAVGGDRVDCRLLIDPGTEVHAFDPAPSDIRAVYSCDCFLYIGGESDEWANTLLGEADVNTLVMMDYVHTLDEDETDGEEHGHSHGDGEHGADEHIWTSPTNAIQMVEAIADELCALDAENASFYRENCAAYTEKIAAVRAEIAETVAAADAPYLLVADRFPLKYFTEEFAIPYTAAFGGCATGTDISLKTMTRLVKTVEERGLQCAFYTEMSSRNIANALAEETGVCLYELNSAHNVTLDQFNSGVTYVDLMKQNARVLREGWSE